MELWREVTGQPEITQVDVRRIKAREHIDMDTGEVTENPIASAAAEVGKYATKPSDYVTKKGKDFYVANGSVVNLLAHALKGKRLIGWGGELDKIRKRLELADAEGRNVDLVDTGGESEQIRAMSHWIYRWVPGLKNYVN
ncbi:protein rep [Erwinia tracheiphila]|uniref:Uncharacterized protein n=1 Tax=Erwinia tracheiphila TaxID=65700 RepID=A0A0M2KH43_9GAMM|nr:protein rep [Erwinia tracheiphila]EOS93557.1 replication protein Rep [Erwinia tracheiphila PSU-1]AXF77836.1 hypothetical protein AV903_20290 [Erwinia tracheiphila]KKF36553.1 hypothetical protein SY86_15700 [Erwinia tracheiphila]UIA83460.1 protein rep [Erwinia tracheiphila]UIA87887.1 protein rep [Erwinia tracheiphila]